MYLHWPFLGVWLVCFLVGLWVVRRFASGVRYWALAGVGALLVSYLLTALIFALFYGQF